MIKIIEDNAHEAVRRSFYADTLSEDTLDVIADHIEDTYDEITRCQIDEILANTYEYDSLEEALYAYDRQTEEQLSKIRTILRPDICKKEVIAIP